MTTKKTKSKIGRPKSENPKDNVCCFRLTEKEYQSIEAISNITGKNIGQHSREFMGIGILTTYLLTKYTIPKKDLSLFVVEGILKDLCLSWTTDPTQSIPKTIFDDLMNSKDFPKDLKMAILEILG
jgi:hypothetical protein